MDSVNTHLQAIAKHLCDLLLELAPPLNGFHAPECHVWNICAAQAYAWHVWKRGLGYVCLQRQKRLSTRGARTQMQDGLTALKCSEMT